MSSFSSSYPVLARTMKMLCESAWKDADINQEKIDRWLGNFTGDVFHVDTERAQAFHLLTNFLYFGQKETTECLRVLFQERLLYPLAQRLLTSQGTIPTDIFTRLHNTLKQTVRIVGVGNPSESGTTFLYPFRQSNSLPKEIFSSITDIVGPAGCISSLIVRSKVHPSGLEHLIYLDDFCATGEQVVRLEKQRVAALRQAVPHLRIDLFLLFATSSSIKYLTRTKLFDSVEAVIVFDSDYRVFDAASQFYRHGLSTADIAVGRAIMAHYGQKIGAGNVSALGFGDSQMLVGFRHNTPDNTLPVFWAEKPDLPWYPIFPRSPKFESF